MPRISRPTMEGFLIPDRLCTVDTIDAAKSSYTQAGLYPGIPEAAQPTSCVLQASGDMVSSDDVVVSCQVAGMPDRQCEIVHRLSSAAATTTMGWEQPNVITGVEILRAYDSGETQSEPCPVTLSDGTVLVIHDYTSSIPSARTVRCTIVGADGAVGSSSTVVSLSALSTYGGHPCACVLEDDRVLVFWGQLVEAVGSYFDTWEVCASITDDGGATWSTIARGVLPIAYRVGSSGNYSIDPAQVRMAAAYKDGQILLIVTVKSDANDVSLRQHQYASVDGGASFTLVDASDGQSVRGGDRTDIVVHNGYFIVGMLRQVANSTLANEYIYPQTVRLGSAYDPMFSGDFTQVSATMAGTWTADAGTDYYVSDGDFSLVSLNGILYCYWRMVDTPYTHRIYYSIDNSDTWTFHTPTGDADPIWFSSTSATQHWAGWRCAVQRGRVLMVTSVDGDTQPEKHLWLLTLGGWTDQTLPQNQQDAAPRIRSWSHWGRMWMPTGLPSNYSIVTVSGTAATNTVAAGYWNLATTTGNTYYAEAALTGTGSSADVGVMVEFEVDIPGPNPTLGTSSTGGTVQMGVRVYTQDLGVSVALGYDYIHLYDDIAGTKLGHFAYPGSRLVMRVYIGDGTVRTFYRTVGNGEGVEPTRAWTTGPTGSLTTGSPSPTDVIQWGHIDASAANCSTKWWRVQWANEDAHAFPHDLAEDGFTNPDDLSGAYLTSAGTELRDGLIVSAGSGPYYVGESHTIPREWEYAITQALVQVEPSRSTGWRSTSDAADQYITFDRQLGGQDSLVRDVWAVCLWGINFKEFKVYTYNAGVAALIDTVDVSEEFSGLGFDLYGDTVRPSSSVSSTVTRWIARNELAGGVWVDDSGNHRRIVANDPGVWGDYSTRVTPRLYLDPDGIDGSEDGNGTAGYIIPPRCFWFYRENQAGGKNIEELRIRINAQTTLEGYFKIDLMFIGEMVIPGTHPSWGKVRRKQPNVVLTEYEDGRRSAVEKGESRRTLSIAWTDGIPQYPLGTADPDPSWYASHSATGLGVPMVCREDTPGNLWGLLDQIGGASTVIAWVRSLDQTDASVGTFAVAYTDPDRVIPVRWMGAVEVADVQDRSDTPVSTVATITLEEEL